MMATQPNDTALRRKAPTSPPAAIRMPAMAGPMKNARLSSVAQTLLAGPRSASSSTSDGR